MLRAHGISFPFANGRMLAKKKRKKETAGSPSAREAELQNVLDRQLLRRGPGKGVRAPQPGESATGTWVLRTGQNDDDGGGGDRVEGARERPFVRKAPQKNLAAARKWCWASSAGLL
jgi:hypothetical protein